MKRLVFLGIIALALLSVMALHVPDAWARAGGGGGRSGGGGSSIGSRGSRSFSAPAQATTPTSPSRALTNPAPAAAPFAPQRPSFMRNMMGGIAGFAIGGLIGSMLFGGGFGGGLGGGGGFGGIGLMEIVLIGGALFLLFAYLRRRRAEQAQPAYGQQPAYAMAGGPSGYATGSQMGSAGTTVEMEPPAQSVDLERGLGYIRQMDAGFDPAALVTWARGLYLDVQTTLKSRDMSGLRDRLAPEIYTELQAQCDRLRGARQTNVVERIDIRRAELTEAWQEGGRDYVTVYVVSSMLDYTVDDGTGAVVEGSKTAPQEVTEFWTLARPVGPNPWQLSAIQSP
jgi:predicted lipid-binding transport protein (Tim44 family)